MSNIYRSRSIKILIIMEKIVLKQLITHSNKNIYIPLLTGIFMAFYSGSGAISAQNAAMLWMPKFEENIPFMIWTIWIYIVFYPVYLIWALYGFRDEIEMNKTLYGFLILTIISCTIFILLPISYPRELFPLPLGDDSISVLIFKLMRAADKSSNCLPSLHVGLCYLFGYGFFKESKRKFLLAFCASTIISISTLTTKQHYIYDIIAGFILASLIYFFFQKCVEIKKA